MTVLKRHLRILEHAFAAEIERAMNDGSLPIQVGSSKPVRECVELGYLEERVAEIVASNGFVITVRGHELTHRGRLVYCRECEPTPAPNERAVPVLPVNSAVDGRRRGGIPLFDLDLEQAWIDNGPSPAGNPGPYLHAPRMDSTDRTKPHPEETVHRIYSRLWVGNRFERRTITGVRVGRIDGMWHWIYKVAA